MTGPGAGRYTIVRPIGQGGHATVWLARDHDEDVWVALKTRDQKGETAELRFRRERRLRDVEHEGLVTPLDPGLDDETGYITFRLVQGGTLEQRVAADGPLPPGAVAAIVRRLIESADYVHGLGIFHRDIQPSNVLLDVAETTAPPLANLADFGLASFPDGIRLSRTDDPVGTAGFRAPELFGGAAASRASDLYGIGVTAYHALTGRVPVHPSEPRSVEHALPFADPDELPLPDGTPDELATVVRGLLALDPGARTRAAPALALLAAVPVTDVVVPLAIEVDDPPPRRPRARRRRRVLAAAGVVLLLVAGAAYAGAAQWSRSSWFLAFEGSQVAIFRGRPDDPLGFAPTLVDRTEIEGQQLTTAEREGVLGHRSFSTLGRARAAVQAWQDAIDHRTVVTVVGTGTTTTYPGDDRPGPEVALTTPGSLAVGPDGALVYGDGRLWVRTLADGRVEAVAGDGFDDPFDEQDGEPAETASFRIDDLAVDPEGAVVVSDGGAGLIRVVRDGAVFHLAGRPAAEDEEGSSPDGSDARTALINPGAVAVDGRGTVYFTDAASLIGGRQVRRIGSDRRLSTVAGDGSEVFDPEDEGGDARRAGLAAIVDLAFDQAGDLYIADGAAVRVVDGDLRIRTLYEGTPSGRSAPFNGRTDGLLDLSGLAVGPDGRVFITNWGSTQIREVHPDGTATVVAGTVDGRSLGDDGPALEAGFSMPSELAVDGDGQLYVSDPEDLRIRRIGRPR